MDDCPISTLDCDALSRRFGFDLPRPLVKLFELLQHPDGTIDGSEGSLFHRVTGLILMDASDACRRVPPEFFVIGRTGMDGVLCGYVIHDAKLIGDMPLALFDPAASRADYLALDTRRSLGVLMGMQYAQYVHDPAQRDVVKEIIGSMHFDPDELPVEPPLDVRPRIPPGWRLAMTADGLGVVAESRFFAPGQEYDEEIEAFEWHDLDTTLENAAHALRSGYAASALWHLRNAYAFLDADGDALPLIEPFTTAYHAMNRSYSIDHLQRWYPAVH